VDPGCFITDPDPKIFSVRIPDPDPNIFHPGSYIKRGMKSKNYFMFLLVSGRSLKVKKIIGSRIWMKFIRDPGGQKALDPGSLIPDPQHWYPDRFLQMGKNKRS
jgi:hypothetical protein